MDDKPKVRTCLWFEKDGEEAAHFYCSLLPNSRVEGAYAPQPGPPIVVDFTLGGAPYQILIGGPHYKLSPAASISVLTEDQEETDRLWSALLADGGEESVCGWLTDRFGVSWQIVPKALMQTLWSDDKDASMRAHKAMMTMRKINIAAIEKAFKG